MKAKDLHKIKNPKKATSLNLHSHKQSINTDCLQTPSLSTGGSQMQ